MRALLLAGVLGIWTLIAAMAQPEEEIVLPRQMGAINDYAAVIGPARAALQTQLDEIKKNFDVEIVILATIYDPYDDPQRFAQSIWESWGLGERTALLLFTKERPERWVFELKLGEALRLSLRPEHLERLRQGLRAHLERRRVQTAIEESVVALHAMLDGSYGQPPPAPRFEFDFAWLWIALGALLLVSVFVGARTFLRALCPRCGSRMRTYHGYGTRSWITYRSCPRCGYARGR
ncbi:MAG: TPM domain-containing protein [Candidatus Bipolaricaulota bacterium]|nr:TPM domain-containing protein [Candidatus Bipolaricaulota bacterium]MCS7273999.1 TPM domain-containing protein [Candidatus Bipolaricaulota bacterium]MDW8111352.1 TPM domain-containing protein [Candidatus Bipolaricaulota bacterium]MDW8329228.1 TPM domain-containing protein [Candidatus Bipolaricaulota bacterium]